MKGCTRESFFWAHQWYLWEWCPKMESISDISGTTSYSTNTKFFCIITILNDYYYFFHAYHALLFLKQWQHCWGVACAAAADESIQWFPFTNLCLKYYLWNLATIPMKFCILSDVRSFSRYSIMLKIHLAQNLAV